MGTTSLRSIAATPNVWVAAILKVLEAMILSVSMRISLFGARANARLGRIRKFT